MHANNRESEEYRAAPCQKSTAPDLDAWFAVDGDADDFIFFGENTKDHSEK